jgi:hypothetical protein
MDTFDALRLKLFTPSEVKAAATNDFPKVYGLVMDWSVGSQTSTTFAMCDGKSGLYAPRMVLCDEVMQNRVKNRALSLVKTAGEYYDAAVPASDYPLPKPGNVRFYLLGFDGARVIESTESALSSGKDKCSALWGSVQALVVDMRRARAGHFSKPDTILTLAFVLVLCVHYVCRSLLGFGPWISAEDAQRTAINALAKLWDNSPWLDFPLIALALGYLWKSWRKTRIPT